MDDTTETVADQHSLSDEQDTTLLQYAGERTHSTARIAIVLITDAALFVLWIGVAWGAQLVADLAKTHGVNEHFAHAFMWISSGSTLLLTLFYIVADITKEFRRLFYPNRQTPRQAQ